MNFSPSHSFYILVFIMLALLVSAVHFYIWTKIPSARENAPAGKLYTFVASILMPVLTILAVVCSWMFNMG